ncbi:MAG: MoaD/ThiS family protein [Treponema sp.]|nr:MoaD/ThiS family protein [Treponema sp.]
MKVQIRYRAQLSALVKMENESITAADVKDVLRHIKRQFSAKAYKLAKKMLIVVNGQSILMLKHFNTVLKDGDEVSFLPICGGG